MESVKPTSQYKFQHFQISLTAYSEQKVDISVLDPLQKIQFEEKGLTLSTIGASTLMKAFEQDKIEIKMDMKVTKTQENPVLKVEVLVCSQFLKPVQESFEVKKKREVSEAEILKTAVDGLTSKLKTLKDDPASSSANYANIPDSNEKYMNSGGYDAMGSIRLNKGKYLLTISFLLKTNNQWLYIYVNQGQQMLQNAGFYTPTSGYFMPHVLRKVHSVNSDNEMVTINTSGASSYPVTIKNFVITARLIE